MQQTRRNYQSQPAARMRIRAEAQNSETSSNSRDDGEEKVTVLLPPARIDTVP
jgi:hypothetical protein